MKVKTKYIKIELTTFELLFGALVGVYRQMSSLKFGVRESHGHDPRNGWQSHIEGSLGELAVTKYKNLYWVGGFDRGPKGYLSIGDVGKDEVRTGNEHWKDLIVRKNDPDDKKFICVTGLNGSYRIHGWIYARDAKKPKYWGDPTGKREPAYFVPKEILNDMEKL